ncbi:MAG: NAD(P)H-hydrate epimerase, partial [Chitinophagales bacterium]
MKILSTEQVRKADQYTIKNEPIASIDLMERASKVFCKWFTSNFHDRSSVSVFCGQGNNGGDGLVVSRILLKKGFSVKTVVLKLKEKGSPDFESNLKRLQDLSKSKITFISAEKDIEKIDAGSIAIDALFGSGLDRPLEGLPEKLVKALNNAASIRVAIDIPSGLKADSPSSGTIFMADYTFSFERPKLSFFLAQHFPYVGYWISRSIGLDPEFIAKQDCTYHLIDFSDAAQLLKTRYKFNHKGDFGHALLIGGSYGKAGAI